MLLCALLALAGCGGARSAQDISGDPPREPQDTGGDLQLVDWAADDARFPRDTLIRTYLFQLLPPDDPYLAYRRAARFTADGDSLGIAEFLKLAPAARDDRRRQAAAHRDRALALRRAQRAWWWRVQDNPGGFSVTGQPPDQTGDGALQAIGHLVNAVGADPTDAASWCDLAALYSLVGDARRAAAAQDAGLDAVARLRRGTKDEARLTLLNALSLRLLLDRAWRLRDAGQFDACLDAVAAIGALMKTDTARTPDQAREARILRGLALAESGRTGEARQIARELAPQRLPRRSPWFVQNDAASPVVHSRAFESVDSDFASRWIRAVAFTALGDRDHALAQTMEPDYRTEFPAHLNHRFWNDVGRVREHFGEIPAAHLAYVMAAVYRPLFVYYPMVGARGAAQVYGQPGAGRLYYLGCGRFYACGSLFSYAAARVMAVELERDPRQRADHAERALDALDACLRRNIQPVSALALRGRVHYRAGNLAQAEDDLQQAARQLRALGREDADVALILAILRFNREDYRAALPALQTYTRLRPDEGLGWRLLGLSLLHAGQHEAALAAMDTSLRLEPDAPAGLYNRGLLLMQMGRFDAARRDLDAAQRLWPDNADVARLRDLLDQARPPRVELSHDDFDLQVEAGPDARAEGGETSPLNLMPEAPATSAGVREAWLGLDAEAAARLLTELRLRYVDDPTPANRRAYAWCLLQAGQAAEVRRLLGPLWDAGIDREELAILLRADRALGLPARARHLARQLDAGRTDPPDSGFWELVAAICLENGEPAAGRRALDHALSLDPGNAPLRRLRDGAD